MLRLITGSAGTGKTGAVINEIKRGVENGQGGIMLIVPEQYSHEAERELCRRCGDRLSLYAEVLSFTGLARKMAASCGGAAAPWLDKGGRLLCMALALRDLGPRLRVYSAAQRRAELQSMLLSAVDEFKAACVGYSELSAASAACAMVTALQEHLLQKADAVGYKGIHREKIRMELRALIQELGG